MAIDAQPDKEAELFVREYPRVLKDFTVSLADLKQIKLNQYKIDPLEKACIDADKNLREDIAETLKEAKEDGADKIEDEVKKLANNIDQLLEDGIRLYKKVDSIAREVKRFSYRKGAWNAPERTLDSAADGIVTYMKETLKRVEKICEPLTEGEKIEYVRSAISELDDIDKVAEKFIEDGEAWFKNSRSVFTISCKAQEEIRQAYCQGDYEPNNNFDLSKYNTVANNNASKVIDKLKIVLKSYNALEQRGKKSLNRAYNKEVERLLSNMKKRRDGLARITKAEHLKGSRNPKIQTWINYGKQMHKNLETRYDCDLIVTIGR